MSDEEKKVGYNEKLEVVREGLERDRIKSPHDLVEELKEEQLMKKESIKEELKRGIRHLREKGYIDKDSFSDKRIDEYVEILKNLIGIHHVYEEFQFIDDLHSLDLTEFENKYKLDEYARLRWVIARGNNEQLKKEWHKMFEIPYFAKYLKKYENELEKFIYLALFYNLSILEKIDIPLRETYELLK